MMFVACAALALTTCTQPMAGWALAEWLAQQQGAYVVHPVPDRPCPDDSIWFPAPTDCRR